MTVTRRKERGSTAAVLAAANEVLLSKEWCIETDTGRCKIGDGVTAWNALPYAAVLPSESAAAATAHVAAADPHTGYRRESVPITAADVAADIVTQAELDALDATYVRAGTPTVLQWDPATPQSVYHGRMWPLLTDLGPFWWECWCAPTAGAEYWISEGYGGAHAILAGFGGGPGPFTPTGNIWNGVGSTSFGGAYAAQVGEWLHYIVTWDGATIWVLINGVVVGSVPFTGPRRAQFGTLAIGGTDHSNFSGRIAQVRAWEGNVPAASPWYSFGGIVDRYFGDSWNGWPDGAGSYPAQFATSYLNVGDTFPDLSGGYGGRLHPGHSYAGSGVGIDNTAAPHPTRVADLTAPFGNQYSVARTRTVPSPAATPAGAKIWDSFSRADTIPAFLASSGVAIGATEGGTLGVKTWAHPFAQWCVFDGSAICLSQQQYVHVANDSADMDVRVGRVVSAGQVNLYYGSAVARLKADLTSGWRAYTFKDYLGAIRVVLLRPDGSFAGNYLPVSTTWKYLRLVASGTTFTVYVDDGTLVAGRPAGWTQLGQVTGETANQTEVGAGLYHDVGIGTAARYTDFEVR